MAAMCKREFFSCNVTVSSGAAVYFDDKLSSHYDLYALVSSSLGESASRQNSIGCLCQLLIVYVLSRLFSDVQFSCL